MVSPTQLFSMLTQAVAGIVGFVVSFGAVLYTLERQRRERRTERLREELRDFKSTYENVINAIWLATAAAPVTSDSVDEIDLEQPEDQLRDMIENETNEVDKTLFSYHMMQLKTLLEDINPENDYLLPENGFQKFENSIDWVTNYLDAGNRDQNIQLYIDLSNYVSTDSIQGDHYHTDVLDKECGDKVRYWLENVADGRHHAWSMYDKLTSDLTGKNFFSITTVLQYVCEDYNQVEAHISQTTVGYSPGIQTVVRLAAVLTLFGVFIPLAFVVKLPAELSGFVIGGWGLFFVQIVLLLINMVLVYH